MKWNATLLRDVSTLSLPCDTTYDVRLLLTIACGVICTSRLQESPSYEIGIQTRLLLYCCQTNKGPEPESEITWPPHLTFCSYSMLWSDMWCCKSSSVTISQLLFRSIILYSEGQWP